MVAEILRDSASAPVKAAKFHNTLADATVAVCLRMARETGLRRVCLSGGTFQNMRLLGTTTAALRRNSLEVFLHAHVPPNDGGIALGQAAIASALDNINL
jgi:hydrogenase maturation protein HypF